MAPEVVGLFWLPSLLFCVRKRESKFEFAQESLNWFIVGIVNIVRSSTVQFELCRVNIDARRQISTSEQTSRIFTVADCFLGTNTKQMKFKWQQQTRILQIYL